MMWSSDWNGVVDVVAVLMCTGHGLDMGWTWVGEGLVSDVVI